MHLKQALKKHLETKIVAAKKTLEEYENSLDALNSMNMNNATYIVFLESYWEDSGEKSITIRHEGSIERAIMLAEKSFKKTNSTSEIQAKYHVSIRIGELGYPVPEEYWNKDK